MGQVRTHNHFRYRQNATSSRLQKQKRPSDLVGQAFVIVLVEIVYYPSSAAAPPTISRISLVMAACLALL